MTVAEFIVWLQTQDQDAIVQVMVQQRAPTYCPWGENKEVDFTPDLSDYTDFRTFAKYEWAKDLAAQGHRVLVLGSKD